MEREQAAIQLSATLMIVMLLLMAAPVTHAAVEVLEFSSERQEQRYLDLIDELRCMVCQNQNLADSTADLAKDLRERTYQMVRTGKTGSQIIEYMVARYGDFVIYRPPLKASTYLLWFGPLAILLLAVVTFILYSRRMRDKAVLVMSPEQRRKAQQLLDE